MKKTNKIILSLGTVASIVAPVVAVVSCGNQNDVQTGYYKASKKIVLKLDKVIATHPEASLTGQNVEYLSDMIFKFISEPVETLILGYDGKTMELKDTAIKGLNDAILAGVIAVDTETKTQNGVVDAAKLTLDNVEKLGVSADITAAKIVFAKVEKDAKAAIKAAHDGILSTLKTNIATFLKAIVFK
ncbi:MAG: variable surface lipoprotein [Mycoplasmataceae bacterium]|nr:variable surface lipoprotein [Mycoplasmataceae bacterium]